jgi:diguanylate cyclase (GGDEF)-like protein
MMAPSLDFEPTYIDLPEDAFPGGFGPDESPGIVPALAPQVDEGHDRLDRLVASVAKLVTHFPRWVVLANLSALSVLAWWASLAIELSGRRSHLGSTLVLISSLGLTLVAIALVTVLQRTARLGLQRALVGHEARHDPLTGVLSRAGITADIGRRLEDPSGEGVTGILFCDIDRLKVINDSLGHGAGDQVLQIVAARLAGAVRDNDSIGRFAGDKFVIASSELPAVRDLEILADRLTESLKRPVVLADGSSQSVSCSIGIAWTARRAGRRWRPTLDRLGSVPEESATTGELLRDAGSAMNTVKSGGGVGYALFDPEVRARAVARLQLEQDLRRGLAGGEIVVHYQPILDVATGDADRYEALVRWQHPERGMIHPADFLSVAAESSLIVDIGELVLEQACQQGVEWTGRAGHPVTVAVNMGERQLLDLALVGSVSRALAESGLPPGQLELEITEELVIDKLDQAMLVLRQLELLGVGLAIDDFGTSQASLARLQRLAMVSTLKIDRVFVEGLADASIDRSIVAAVVNLAGEIGMSVVAEGVEQVDQSRILSDLGVRFQQGFLYQRPGPPEVMDRHIRRLAQRPRLVPVDSGFSAGPDYPAPTELMPLDHSSSSVSSGTVSPSDNGSSDNGSSDGGSSDGAASSDPA